MIDEPAAKAWERQPEESGPAFHAFAHYRDQVHTQPRRSLRDAYRLHWSACLGGDRRGTGKVPTQHPTNWKKWAVDFRWVERVALYDAYLDEEKRRSAERDLVEMNARHRQILKANLGVGSTFLTMFYDRMKDPAFRQQVEGMHAEDFGRLLVQVQKNTPALLQQERITAGLETDIVKIQTSEQKGQSLADLVATNPDAQDAVAELMEHLAGRGGEPGGPRVES